MSVKNLNQIIECNNCNLCYNQRPLIDNYSDCQILWVGLSAKKISNLCDSPLSKNTNSGSIIHLIEKKFYNIKMCKTNLVKCLPLTTDNRLRYPTRQEISKCIGNLQIELDALNPKIVFLLGEKVYSSVSNFFDFPINKIKDYKYEYIYKDGINFIPIQHPSYIYVYKKQDLNIYIENIEKMINLLIPNKN